MKAQSVQTNVAQKYENLIVAVSMQEESVGKLVSFNDEAYFMFNFKNMSEFYFEYLHRAALLADGEFKQDHSMPKISKEERMRIYATEKYEREMILNDLIFSTHINISKFNEPETSRRFLTNNDSCLSFVQVSVDEEYYRWMFVSRSTEINRMLPADLYTIGIIMNSWTAWFRRYTHTRDRGIKLTIVMNNPHYYKG